MEKILEFAERFCEGENEQWSIDGLQLIGPVGTNGRKQRLRLGRLADVYTIETTILDSEIVTKTNKSWRDYARLAWKLNSERDIVNFTFDEEHRMIGAIEHPCEFLDFEEFVIYAKRLAVESDRVEYLLTGKDLW